MREIIEKEMEELKEHLNFIKEQYYEQLKSSIANYEYGSELPDIPTNIVTLTIELKLLERLLNKKQ